MSVAIPDHATGIAFNTALGYPQVSVIHETGTERFLRCYSLSTIRRGQRPCVLTYSDFHCDDTRTEVPRSVCHLINLDAINAIEKTFDQIRNAALAYLESASPEAERDLCTLLELSGLQ